MSDSFVPIDPDAQLGYLLVRGADLVSRPWLAALRKHDINHRQFSVLALLARDPDQSQAELARRVMITPQSMSELLGGLLDAALVTRDEAAPGRAARLQLTTKGRKLLAKAYPIVEATNRESFAALSGAEQRELARLLGKLIG